jgi:glycosyltransferase involved in cell wall biosynthesis
MGDGGMFNRAMDSVRAQILLPDAVCVAIDVEGQGAAPTRTRALNMARTDWVAFLDSDDVWLPKHLYWLINHAQETGADFVYSWFKVLQQFPDGSTNVLEVDPIFPPGHYLKPWDPENPIETTVTTLVRTELAQAVGFKALDRGHDANSGEDFNFREGIEAAGGKVSHLVRKSWLWCHHTLPGSTVQGNTSGLPHKGDGPTAVRE